MKTDKKMNRVYVEAGRLNYKRVLKEKKKRERERKILVYFFIFVFFFR